MNAPLDAVVFSVGARTHNALTPLQVAMGFRADKSDPRETYLIDRGGEPMVMCRLLSIGDEVVGWPRLLALAVPPLRQALLPLLAGGERSAAQAGPLPLFVSLAEPGAGVDPKGAAGFLDALTAQVPITFDRARSMSFPAGRAGGVAAMAAAIELLERGQSQLVVVGGVDSYYEPSRLERLDGDLRLHSLGCENGFVPGEGAAFALLGRRGALPTPPIGRLHSVAVASEPYPYGADRPCMAQAMTDAVQRVTTRAGLDHQEVGWVLTDVVNERHRVDEWMYVTARANAAFHAEVVHDQPLLCTGDLGASSAPVLLSIATSMWQAECAPGDLALVAVHSDGAERGAFVVSRPGPGRARSDPAARRPG